MEGLSQYPKERIDINKSYKVLETVDFLTDQLEEINKATERVWIQTMALESGHFTNVLIQKLLTVRERGIEVKVIHDAYSDYVTDNTFNHLPLLKREDRQYKRFLLEQNVEVLAQLKNSCSVFKTNVPRVFKNNPIHGVMGRDHKKITIIDNIAYIGGINLATLDAKRTDFMTKIYNPVVVDQLANIFNQSFEDKIVSDSAILCDSNNVLLIDAGIPSQSITMHYVDETIDREKEKITLISPFLPSGTLRKKLNQAQLRGVDVNVITSEQEQLGFTPRLSQLVHNFGQTKPRFNILRYPGVVHAKALLFGGHSAIVGSHNFDELFVRLGTEEISLFTTEPELLMQLKNFSTQLRNKSTLY